MEQQVTVAIIEDHPVVTEGVASWIRSDPGQRVREPGADRDADGPADEHQQEPAGQYCGVGRADRAT